MDDTLRPSPPAAADPPLPAATYRLGGYTEYAPPGALRPFVQAMWTYVAEPCAGTIPPPGHRVLPDAGVSLCFACRRRADGAAVDPVLTVMGPIRSFHFYEPLAGARLEALRLKPELARALLGADPREHEGVMTDIRAISPRRHGRLVDALCATRSSADALALMIRAIADQPRTMRDMRVTTIASTALDAIRATRDATLRLHDVARSIGVSERHVRRAIVESTGAGPKYVHRVHRLNRAVAAADRTRRPRWARIAVECGYYDQPHLIREVRDLAGRPPAELHAERALQRPAGDVRNLQSRTDVAG